MVDPKQPEQLDALSESSWETVRSRDVYTNKWTTLVEDELRGPHGEAGQYAYLAEKDCVIICPLFANGDTMLVRQWRHAFNCSTWELPCGCVDNNEDPLLAAQRELAEECQLQAADWTSYGSLLHSDARVRGRIHFFLARKLGDKSQTKDIEEWDLEARRIAFAQIDQAIQAQQIESIMTVYFLQRIQRDLFP